MTQSKWRLPRTVTIVIASAIIAWGVFVFPTHALAADGDKPSVSWDTETTMLEQSNQGSTGNAIMRPDSLPYYEDYTALKRVFGGVNLVYEGERNQPGNLKTQDATALVKNFPAGHYYVHCDIRGAYGAAKTITEFDVTDAATTTKVVIPADVTMTSGVSACYFSSLPKDKFNRTGKEKALNNNRPPSLGYLAPVKAPFRWCGDTVIIPAQSEEADIEVFSLSGDTYTTFVGNTYYNMLVNIPQPKDANVWGMNVTDPADNTETKQVSLLPMKGMNNSFWNQANASLEPSIPGSHLMKLTYVGKPLADDEYLAKRKGDGLALELGIPALMQTRTEVVAKALPIISQPAPDTIMVTPPEGENHVQLGKQENGYGIEIFSGDEDITKYFVKEGDSWVLTASEETEHIFTQDNVVSVQSYFGQEVGSSHEPETIITVAKDKPSVKLDTAMVPPESPTVNPPTEGSVPPASTPPAPAPQGGKTTAMPVTGTNSLTVAVVAFGILGLGVATLLSRRAMSRRKELSAI